VYPASGKEPYMLIIPGGHRQLCESPASATAPSFVPGVSSISPPSSPAPSSRPAAVSCANPRPRSPSARHGRPPPPTCRVSTGSGVAESPTSLTPPSLVTGGHASTASLLPATSFLRERSRDPGTVPYDRRPLHLIHHRCSYSIAKVRESCYDSNGMMAIGADIQYGFDKESYRVLFLSRYDTRRSSQRSTTGEGTPEEKVPALQQQQVGMAGCCSRNP
jgi:hypothetical protein